MDGSTESVKLLLDNGADVAATNDVSIIINYTPIVIVKSNILLSGWVKVTAGAVYLIQCVYMYMYSLITVPYHF